MIDNEDRKHMYRAVGQVPPVTDHDLEVLLAEVGAARERLAGMMPDIGMPSGLRATFCGDTTTGQMLYFNGTEWEEWVNPYDPG